MLSAPIEHLFKEDELSAASRQLAVIQLNLAQELPRALIFTDYEAKNPQGSYWPIYD